MDYGLYCMLKVHVLHMPFIPHPQVILIEGILCAGGDFPLKLEISHWKVGPCIRDSLL